jgi:hypothetical protein
VNELYKALSNTMIEEVPGLGKVIKLPDNKNYICEPPQLLANTLILRDAYEDIWSIIQNMFLSRNKTLDIGALLIVGAVGTGKV